MNPETLEEWQEYVNFLDEDELFQQATAAGSMKFMMKLSEEGASPEMITGIQKIFALRFAEAGLEPPARSPECVVDYRRLVGI